jgi:transposase-like protein
MSKADKYSISDLQRDFPNDEVALEFVFNTLHSKECSCGGTYKKVKDRKQYQCSKCRFQIAPTAGTIFHKSATNLTTWFYALFIFSNAKSGISAKELERQIGVTYKCAYRMLKQIREALEQDNDKLDGDVEMDTGYFGGKQKLGKGKQAQAIASKGLVMAAIERGGNMKAMMMPSIGKQAHDAFLTQNVAKTARLLTDGAQVYKNAGYKNEQVIHSKKEYARGDVHINTVESFFGHVKRSITGTYKTISKEQLQAYLDSFVFHYNNRHSDTDRFAVLVGAVLRGAK